LATWSPKSARLVAFTTAANVFLLIFLLL
jgi:hypothetical protein